MIIAMMNKYYYLKAGSERYFFELTHLLEEHGHQVVPFSMNHPRNFETPWSKYFVPHVDYNERMSPVQKAAAAVNSIYNRQARHSFESLIQAAHPDILHVHNIYHQISYSPLIAAQRHRIPVVFTAHDYKLVCPNNQMFCHGEICECCAGGRSYNAFLRRCGSSTAESFLLMVEAMVNRHLFDAMKNIDLVITPSRFMRNILAQYGIPEEKLVHYPNILDPAKYEPKYEGHGSILFFGRLVPEKGADVLLRAYAELNDSTHPLRIAGEGPEEASLKRMAEELNLRGVEFMGYQTGDVLKELIRNASVVVVPSQWHENLPYSVLESMAFGKAVIGSDTGGTPELIEDGVTGRLFPQKDRTALVDALRQVLSRPEVAMEMGRKARKKVEREFNPEAHYEFMMERYERLIREKRRG